MLAGLEKPDSGRNFNRSRKVFSNNINLEPNKRKVAIVFQNYALACI